MEKNFQQGVKDALPTALGYISIGLACGVVASPYLSPLEMGLMSLLVYAGASQFAMISLIAVHSSLMNIALTVFFINLRNMLMSLHTSPDFKEASLVHNIGIGSLLTDESYGVYLSEKMKSDRITVPWMHGNMWSVIWPGAHQLFWGQPWGLSCPILVPLAWTSP